MSRDSRSFFSISQEHQFSRFALLKCSLPGESAFPFFALSFCHGNSFRHSARLLFIFEIPFSPLLEDKRRRRREVKINCLNGIRGIAAASGKDTHRHRNASVIIITVDVLAQLQMPAFHQLFRQLFLI